MKEEKEQLELFKVRDIGQMMGLAATLIRRHYKHMFKTIGVMSIPLVLAASTFYILGSTEQMNALNEITRGGRPPSPFSTWNINTLFSFVASYLAYTSIFWGTVYYVQLYDEKGPENFQYNDLWNKVFRHGWKAIFSNLIIWIISGFALGLSILVAFLIITVPLTFILALAIMGFAFLWQIVYLYERIAVFDAMDFAMKLMKKQWWKAIALALFSIIITYGFILLPTFIFAAFGISELESGQGDPSSFILMMLVFQNIATIVGYLATYFISLSFVAFFLSNKERILHVSLSRRIDKLGEDQELTAYV